MFSVASTPFSTAVLMTSKQDTTKLTSESGAGMLGSIRTTRDGDSAVTPLWACFENVLQCTTVTF